MSDEGKQREKKEANVKSDKKTLAGHFKDIKAEFNKVVWPGKKDLVKQTTTVIITSGIVGGIIVGYDAIFAFGLQMFSYFVVGL